jgi:uncharacterized protein (TIGR02246 family)
MVRYSQGGQMNPRWFSVGAAALVVISLLGAPRASIAQSNSADADSTAIRRIIAQWIDAFNRHDAQGWAAPFTEDCDFTNVTGLTRHGRKEVEDRFKGLFAGPLKDAHRTATVRNIRFVKPDVGAVDAEWELVGSKAADGAENPMRKGMFTWVMVKQDGRWMFADFHESEFTSLK